ncbi:uncharacterized protein LOC126667810 isoform X2 [Mercurialis annua]|uniref:uncharacterized protein LOC126667810 isoform X2 n=1 Tax=Mercurialis annua TaxID=3986 RepID=UPI00215FB161|nr:uncharacterized protein LOC126667810 isoform X2 [Mercurialis annua]XP_050216854.1 uncharacterized protein LOC126667810 isoform X2 [Mercurialis annua]
MVLRVTLHKISSEDDDGKNGEPKIFRTPFNGSQLHLKKSTKITDFQRRAGQLPVQKEGDDVHYGGVMHRDGSILMLVSTDQLKLLILMHMLPSCFKFSAILVLQTRVHTSWNSNRFKSNFLDKGMHLLKGLVIALIGFVLYILTDLI